MKRGDLVVVRERNSLANKARPCLVIQNEESLGLTNYVNVCPLTSVLKPAHLIRILLMPNGANGLNKPSNVEIDLIDSVLASNIDHVIGHVDADTMRKIDTALRRWLSL